MRLSCAEHKTLRLPQPSYRCQTADAFIEEKKIAPNYIISGYAVDPLFGRSILKHLSSQHLARDTKHESEHI